ncbi:hypothetical protein A3SI_08231 [Nitritalea halalkaliphila LW7]|uniref:Uncharacterized protein n=1 Tax=Nitritalea halalkaliphila LW7 TaxID=1189621 RepID=I5C510_9BACT|nr:hypothetical protein [Nitritalea halalkaliphila]EIM76912.1 hypothetical protein A3SI_08231 [Nitritalea halalkaliphila LW7]
MSDFKPFFSCLSSFLGMLFWMCLSSGVQAEGYAFSAPDPGGSTVERFHRQVSYLEGLPSPTVYSLHVTPAGLMYVGTELGIFRFNGFRFERLSMPEARHQPVDNIIADSQGAFGVKISPIKSSPSKANSCLRRRH